MSIIDLPHITAKSLTALRSSLANALKKSTSRPWVGVTEACAFGRGFRGCLVGGAVCIGLLTHVWVLPARAASPPVTLDAQVTISGDLGSLSGHVDVTISNGTAQPLRVVPLWTFPGRLATPPSGATEFDAARMFPRGFDPAGMTLHSVSELSEGGVATGASEHRSLVVRQRSPALAEVDLAAPLAPGADVTLRVVFETRVPKRFGPFGRVPDQLIVDGGFLPRPPPQDASGFHPEAPPGEVRWSLSVNWHGSEQAVLVVNGQHRPLPPRGEAGTKSGGHDDSRPLTGRDHRVSMSVIVGATVSRFAHAQGRFHYIHRRSRCRGAIRGALVDLGCVDSHGQALASFAASLAWLSRGGAPVPGGEIVLVEAPLRRDLALAAPHMVWVSDRAFELLPFERGLKFHRLALTRALFAVVLRDHLARVESDRLEQVVDMVAVALTQAWESHQYGGQETGVDVLSEGAFVAAVDDTINAPQVPFVSSYFVDVDDTDPHRDRFPLFSHQRPSGRLWLAKLRDRIGAQKTRRVVRTILMGPTSLEDALGRAAPDTSLQYLKRWDQGPPKLNYKVGEVITGRDAEGPYVDVEVIREGDAPDFAEPVTVQVTGDGARARETVEIGSARRVVRVRSSARGPEVVIDPAGRLIETSMDGTTDPRRDNRNFSQWRFLFEGFSGNLNSASGYLELSAVGLVKADKEPGHLFVLGAGNRERSASLGGSYLFGFGDLIRPNLHRHQFGVGLGTSWLKPDGDTPSGMALNLALSITDYTYESATDPHDGMWMNLSSGPSLVLHDGDASVGVFADAQVAGLIEVGFGHVLAAQVRQSGLFGDVPNNHGWGVGGLNAVRAFATFAASARHRTLVRFEWRHQYTRNLNWNILSLFWVNGIDGVAFVDTALLGHSAVELFDARALYLGAGYGLRFHFLGGGFFPRLFTVDVGVPVMHGGVLGVPEGMPLSLVLAVKQAF